MEFCRTNKYKNGLPSDSPGAIDVVFNPRQVMPIKALSVFSLFAAALLLSACDSGRAQIGPKKANVLGIATYEKDNYTPTSSTTFAISTDELYQRRNFSGDKATFLWGLVTLKDY